MYIYLDIYCSSNNVQITHTLSLSINIYTLHMCFAHCPRCLSTNGVQAQVQKAVRSANKASGKISVNLKRSLGDPESTASGRCMRGTDL